MTAKEIYMAQVRKSVCFNHNLQEKAYYTSNNENNINYENNIKQMPQDIQKSEKSEHGQMGNVFTKVQNIFLFNGITALLGWNALLGAFDYFKTIYKSYDVFLYFPVPVFLGYTTVAIIFKWMTNKFSYRTLVPRGIIVSNISLLLFLLISVFCKENERIGFWISMINGFFLGFFSNIVQLSFFGMINYFGEKTVSRFTIGTGLSGLSLIMLRAIVAAVFGTQNPFNVIPIIVYFSIAVLFNIFDMYLNMFMFKTQQYAQKIEKPFEQQRKLSRAQNNNGNTNNSQLKQSYLKLLWQSLQNTLPYPLLIFFNFVITFMLFPNLTLMEKTSLSPTWSSITFLLMYNIGDFTGKLLCDIRWIFNSFSTKYLFACRLFFFYTIPIMTKDYIKQDHLLYNNVFPFFNQFLFAFTNGLVVNASFILAYQNAPKQYKKYAGILAGILLQLGITLGTFLAIPYTNLVDPDQN